ncbi:Phosphopantothenate-cysteine ligase /Phosphopantothenoylcysteine decarboxylase [Limimonas halophila]|uniref:Coenzyme A biosynthesis bifunctional protein CoaBC n=1 Tax=Limimonas halophila TaxID=1082479 RepID=A0A1G7R8X1_9PROT|nr:bifunctional phosphopantothenoylcysteine decarboxylase/phosphopantothenate--cysteine ligase CoaBC [Limimonas halophila]SDG07222.1 Phosphopantothenate-cysteine ligase /Phosphopantothenoylcysteine decarboxylase [Limimonas halophila]
MPPAPAGKPLAGKRILLVVSGGIAAYKTPELVRRLRERGAAVRCVLTEAGARFVTPLALEAVSEDVVYRDLWALTAESGMGHIQLSREADLVVIAPASADLLAKQASGLADDLASTLLLATDTEVLAAPAMNVRMWQHPATQANVETLRRRGVRVVGPDAGDMACGEHGPGRMAEPEAIRDAVEAHFGADAPLAGRRALVTSGPTHEPIDPVRYIANRASGRQGHAVAAALARLGADTTLVTGPTAEPDPAGVTVRHVESAREMLTACEAALPVDVAVCAAAVGDWRAAEEAAHKCKREGRDAWALELVQNPDILARLSQPGANRPPLVVGFAAETDAVVANARAKRARKGCDWIVANDVAPGTGTFGGAHNTVHLITGDDAEPEAWPRLAKTDVAERLAARIADSLGEGS